MILLDLSDVPALCERLASAASTCLDATPAGAPGFAGLYHGKPPADCGDGLFVWLERLWSGKEFPNANPATSRAQTDYPMAQIAVTLYRRCWPVLKTDPHNPFPDPAESSVAAYQLQMDAVQLFCCLSRELLVLGGSVLPTAADPQGITSNASIGQMDPELPKGGVAGWTFRFKLKLGPCYLNGCPPDLT